MFSRKRPLVCKDVLKRYSGIIADKSQGLPHLWSVLLIILVAVLCGTAVFVITGIIVKRAAHSQNAG